MPARRFRKRVAKVSAVLFALALLAACGSDNGTADTADATAATADADDDADADATDTDATDTDATDTDATDATDTDDADDPPAGEDFPTQAISLIVGFAPGGGADVFARALTQAAQETLPEQVVVENREGGGGTTASAFVRTQPADGHTILFGHAGSTILTPTISESTDLKWDQFDPIARIHAEEEFLFLRPDSQWETIEELMDHARENPGEVRVGGSAVGGVDSFVILVLEQEADVEFTYIPFDGGGPATVSFLGGNVDVLVGNFSDNLANIEAGEMFPVAVASEERGSQPDVPTLVENGWDVVLHQWRGVFAPQGTPPGRIQILADGFEAALDEDAWATYREASHSVDLFLGPDEFREFLESEEARFVPIIEELDLIGS